MRLARRPKTVKRGVDVAFGGNLGGERIGVRNAAGIIRASNEKAALRAAFRSDIAKGDHRTTKPDRSRLARVPFGDKAMTMPRWAWPYR